MQEDRFPKPEAAASVQPNGASLGLPPEERARAFPSNQLRVGEPSEMPREKKSKKAVPSKPVEVVALRAGFYAPYRIPQGHKFQVRHFSQLQSWMKCTDPEMQKMHEAAMEERKAKIRGRHRQPAED